MTPDERLPTVDTDETVKLCDTLGIIVPSHDHSWVHRRIAVGSGVYTARDVASVRNAAQLANRVEQWTHVVLADVRF